MRVMESRCLRIRGRYFLLSLARQLLLPPSLFSASCPATAHTTGPWGTRPTNEPPNNPPPRAPVTQSPPSWALPSPHYCPRRTAAGTRSVAWLLGSLPPSLHCFPCSHSHFPDFDPPIHILLECSLQKAAFWRCPCFKTETSPTPKLQARLYRSAPPIPRPQSTLHSYHDRRDTRDSTTS